MRRSASAKSASASNRARAGRSKPARREAESGVGNAEAAESSLVMLLTEPEVRLLMQSDHVDERELRSMLDAVSVQLRQDGRVPTDARYRSGVGIILLNARGEVFVGRRIDVKEDAWQMPQGGIERGETPRQAASRELKEEIGTDNAEILAETKGWLYYDVPEQLAKAAWTGRWRGQRQKWFVMLFRGRDSDIDLRTQNPEFNAWRWVPWGELAELAVSFKRQLYQTVLGEFSTVFRD
jgi:putative (di)nucleoside polyphosphate hydrolase